MKRKPKHPRLFAAGADDVLAEINITPLTDVLLVLLIIFLIAAAAGLYGFNLRLPKRQPKAFSKASFKGVMVTLPSWAARRHAVFVGNHLVNLDILPNYLETEKAKKKTAKIVLQIDRAVPYKIVINVMDAAKMSGLDDIAFAVPVQER